MTDAFKDYSVSINPNRLIGKVASLSLYLGSDWSIRVVNLEKGSLGIDDRTKELANKHREKEIIINHKKIKQ